MPVYYDSPKRRFRFQFNRVVRGRRYRTSRLLPQAWDRAQAEAYDRHESARLWAVATGVERPRALISQAVSLYLTHRIPVLRNGIKAARDLSYLAPWIDGRGLDELPDAARAYAAENPELAPATIRNRLAYLRAAVRYAYREHSLGDRDYSDRMRLPSVSNARQVYLEPADMERLARACKDPDTRALIRIAFYTGCRWISELLPRQPSDIVKQGREWWLRVPDTKTGAPKMVPIHPTIRKDLGRLPFPAKHWRQFYEDFEAARARCEGLQHVRMHDMRHSLASALIAQGASLYAVGKVLGHKSAQSTERYAHLYPREAARLIGNLPTGRRRKPAKKGR